MLELFYLPALLTFDNLVINGNGAGHLTQNEITLEHGTRMRKERKGVRRKWEFDRLNLSMSEMTIMRPWPKEMPPIGDTLALSQKCCVRQPQAEFASESERTNPLDKKYSSCKVTR